MNIYLITQKLEKFIPAFNVCTAFVIVAKNEKNARSLAALNCSNEGVSVWLDSEFSDCVEIGLAKELVEKIVIGHYQ